MPLFEASNLPNKWKKRRREQEEYLPQSIGKNDGALPPAPQTVLDPLPVGFGPTPARISVGEAVTALSLVYVCSLVAFNAGYFINIEGHFSELFTFTDLFGTNIAIVQYFIIALIIYCSLSTLGWMFLSPLRERIRSLVEEYAILHHGDIKLFWLGFAVLWLVANLIDLLLSIFHVSTFTLAMIPQTLFTGTLFFYFWVGYKNGMTSLRTLIFSSLLGLCIFSYTSGRAWLKSEINSEAEVQSLIIQDGTCLDRKILRTSGNGLLLFNPTLRAYEFRNKDTIRTIFDRRACT